jgi:Tol biopolymer transport system component
MPVWSRDGRYLAYATNQNGSMDLWVLDSTGGRSVEVTSGPEDDSRPDWSPDGQSIVFLRGVKSCHIFVADPESREKIQLTSGEVCDNEPMVSADGKWVAFIREKTGAIRTSPVLAWASVEGGDVHEMDLKGLTFNASGGVSWSPDAEDLAFAADDGSGNVDIYRARREGGAPTRVTVTPGTDVIPIWSPDGRNIGYTRAAAGETQVWTIPSGGGVPTKVSSEDGANQLSYFSPEGRRIAYMTVLPDGTYDVKVKEMGRQGPGRLILHSDRGAYPMGWSKDGRYVIAWKLDGERSKVAALAADGSEQFLIGESVDEPDGRGYFIDLNTRGLPSPTSSPGGIHAPSTATTPPKCVSCT